MNSLFKETIKVPNVEVQPKDEENLAEDKKEILREELNKQLKEVNTYIKGLERKCEQAKIIGTTQQYYSYKQEILNYTGERAKILIKIEILSGKISEKDTDICL